VYENDAGTAEVLDIRTLGIPVALEVSDDMQPTARKLRLSDTVEFTFQLVDANGDPVPKPGVRFSFVFERTVNEGSFGRDTNHVETGPLGSVELEFRHPDPNPKGEDLGDITQVDLDILDSGTLEVIDRTTLAC